MKFYIKKFSGKNFSSNFINTSPFAFTLIYYAK